MIKKIGRVLFYDYNKNHFGRIQDDISGVSLNFKLGKRENDLSLKDDQLIFYNLQLAKNGTSYYATDISIIDSIDFTIGDYRSIISLFSHNDIDIYNSSGQVVYEEIIRYAQRISDDQFKTLISLLRFYKLYFQANFTELYNSIFNILSDESRWQLLCCDNKDLCSIMNVSQIISIIVNSNKGLLEIFQHIGVDRAYLVLQDLIRLDILSIEDSIKIFENWRYNLLNNDTLYHQVKIKISTHYSNEELYQLAKGSYYIAKDYLSCIDPIEFLYQRANNIVDVDFISKNLELSDNERIRLLESIDEDIVQKLIEIKKWRILSPEAYDEYLFSYRPQLNDAQLYDLWVKQVISLPFSIDSLYEFIKQNGDFVSHIYCVKNLLQQDDFKSLLVRYIDSIEVATKDDVICIISNMIYAGIDISDIKNHDICQAIKLNKWLDRSIDNESEIFDINFIDYIYLLSSEKQTLFLRKLFELHRTNILIIDYKYLERIKLHPKEIDINVLIVIATICKLIKEERFLTNNELYRILKIVLPKHSTILNNLIENDSSSLFDKCRGRYGFYKADSERYPRDIEIDITDANNIQIKINDNYRENADLIKSKFPGIKYDATQQIWRCSTMTSKKMVIDFAEERYDVYIRMHQYTYSFVTDTSRYHPNFCEGSKYHSNRLDKDVYWCYGRECCKSAIIEHKDDYTRYTLFDFISILGIGNENLKKNIRIFYSNLNWFYTAMHHLYCDECQCIIEPYEKQSIVASHTVTKFKCKNEGCTQSNKLIRLNNCFNSYCNGVIDSRRTKCCPNGYIICPECGICCGSGMYDRRLEANVPIPENISNLHWDKKELYCALCGSKLELTKGGDYICSSHPNYIVRIENYRNNILPKRVFKDANE